MEGIRLVYAVIGVPELLVILAIVFLLFGSSKLPGLARSMGSAIRTFRDEAKKTQHQGEVESEPPEEHKEKAGSKSSQ